MANESKKISPTSNKQEKFKADTSAKPKGVAKNELLEEEKTVQRIAKSLSGTIEEERIRLWGILDALPCYVALMDKDHRIRLANKAFKEYFGTSEGFCYSVLRHKDKVCEQCIPYDAFASNSSGVMEWVTPNNKHAFRTYSYPFDDVSGERFLLKVGFSVTANVRMRQALSLSESSYRVITDNLSIGVAVLALDLSVVVGNMRLNQWLGRKAIRGKRLCDLLQCNGHHPFPLPGGDFCPDCPFRLALLDNNTHEKEFRLGLDGKDRIMRLVACPVSPQKKSVRALVLMLEDITKRIVLNRQLQRARNIEAAGTLAGGIAHEINQPLSALNLYASGLQMLLEKSDDMKKSVVSERLDLILKESEKIRSIISNMRALVMRGASAELKGIPLKTIVEAAVLTAQEQLSSRGIEVQIVFPDTLPLVQSHPVQLEQAIINLISNAVHAIDAVLEVEGEALKRVIRFAAEEDSKNNRVVLAVEDSGEGLPKEQERVFDPFFSTKENKGLGLGLSIVHGLVNGWGGELSVRPRGGELGGATFFISFKIAPEQEEIPSIEG